MILAEPSVILGRAARRWLQRAARGATVNAPSSAAIVVAGEALIDLVPGRGSAASLLAALASTSRNPAVARPTPRLPWPGSACGRCSSAGSRVTGSVTSWPRG